MNRGDVTYPHLLPSLVTYVNYPSSNRILEGDLRVDHLRNFVCKSTKNILILQSTLDIADFLGVDNLSAISGFSAISNLNLSRFYQFYLKYSKKDAYFGEKIH